MRMKMAEDKDKLRQKNFEYIDTFWSDRAQLTLKKSQEMAFIFF
jgi:hypothetical protein